MCTTNALKWNTGVMMTEYAVVHVEEQGTLPPEVPLLMDETFAIKWVWMLPENPVVTTPDSSNDTEGKDASSSTEMATKQIGHGDTSDKEVEYDL